MARIVQGAFSAGILAEGMYSRGDTEKFGKGLKDAVNVILRPQGGFSNRAGLETVTAFDTSGASAEQFLLPFAFSTEQTYLLEFTDGVFRVIKDGGYVLDTGVAAKPVSGVTATNPARITMTAAGDTSFFPVGALVFFRDPNGSHKLHEHTLKVVSAAAGDITFAVFDGTALDTTTGSWGTVGAGATLELVYQQTHSITLSDMPKVRFTQDADTMYLAHKLYPPMKITRADHDDWAIANVMFQPGITPVTEVSAVAVTGATQTNPVVITAAAHGLENADWVKITGVVGMTQLNDKIYAVRNKTANTFEIQDRNLVDVDGTGFTAYSSGGVLDSPAAEATIGPGADMAALTTYTYAVAPIDPNTFEEGLPSLGFTVDNDLLTKGSVNHLGWKAHATASRYNVYRQNAGAFGYIGTTTSRSFDDENITPDTSRGVRIDRNPFSAAGDYPSVVSFYEQRLAYGATVNDPQLVEMSRTDNVENFGTSYPALPDDAFRFRIRAKQVNRVRAFVPHLSFAILTSGGEWEIAAQGDGDYARPDKRRMSPISYYGSHDIEPVLIGEVALYVEPSGNVVRDFRLTVRDQPPGDLTILARDLFTDREIVSWAYSKAPNGLLWVVLDNGVLLSMTYLPEHDVWGWTRHVIAGTDVKVKQVSVIHEGAEDTPYFVVSRTLGGTTVTLTERLALRNDTDVCKGYFVDAGFKAAYGAAVSQVNGLLHLRGETVTALVDGDVVNGIVVDGTGTADLGGESGQNISIGLGYTAIGQTLGVAFEEKGRGSTEGRYKTVSEVAVKLEKTRGVEVGMTLDTMSALKEWDATLIGGPIPLRTHTALIPIDGDWLRDATMFVRQVNPLPMTVTGIAPEWETGG